MEKITIQQAIKRLKTSRATLYKYLRQCDIDTLKEKNKAYLTDEQLEVVKQSMSNNDAGKNEVSNTVKTLQDQLKLVQDQNDFLVVKARKILTEKEVLSTQNIELRTRAEVLDEQNKKILFQMGAIGEKVAQLELEKASLLKPPGKKGILKTIFPFWGK